MPVLIAMRGLPGSGKTTRSLEWVDNPANDAVRVNRDDLRRSLFNGEGILSKGKEDAITSVQQAIAKAAIQAGHNVIVDDTNLRTRYLRNWERLAMTNGATFLVEDVTTPVDVCVERDSARARTVGEDVIRTLAQKFLRNVSSRSTSTWKTTSRQPSSRPSNGTTASPALF